MCGDRWGMEHRALIAGRGSIQSCGSRFMLPGCTDGRKTTSDFNGSMCSGFCDVGLRLTDRWRRVGDWGVSMRNKCALWSGRGFGGCCICYPLLNK